MGKTKFGKDGVNLPPEGMVLRSFSKSGAKKANPKINRIKMTKRIQGARER